MKEAVWCDELLGLFLHISPIRYPARFRFTQLVRRRYTLPRSVSLLTHYRRFLPYRHLLTRPISWNVCARSADLQGSAAVHHLSGIAAHKMSRGWLLRRNGLSPRVHLHTSTS